MHLLKIDDFELVSSLEAHYSGITRGIEKESLRISPDGYLSQRPHPQALGATLTNPSITTDYSEALPEFITQPSNERLAPLKELESIHQFTYQNIDDELLWVMSMPCVMGEESDIPIARYGKSNSGQMKEIYRLGLGHRYGRFMQTIAGVHYNFSLPQSFWQALYEKADTELTLQAFIDDKYMALIRNYLRYSWLIPLFFGASPAVCESFIKDKNIDLGELVPGTRYGKYATSLRMSDLGYQNNAQSGLSVSYNSLEGYIAGLESAIRTPDPYYQEIGVKENGQYKQLNANLLQIENEFYSSIRPKRVTQSGERPTKALHNRGIEYIEVRALDLNPFSPIGIETSQVAFLDTFLLACLFAESPDLSSRESGEYHANFRAVVKNGRHPDCCLMFNNRCVSVNSLAENLLAQMEPFSRLLDKVYGIDEHCQIIKKLGAQLTNLDETYSGQIVTSIEARQDGFFPYAMQLSKQHKSHFLNLPDNAEMMGYYRKLAEKSHHDKRQIEETDSVSFETFLANYYR